MRNITEVVTFNDCQYKTTSYYGNPSYWVYFRDAQNTFRSGYTGSNCSCAYSVRNHKDGDKVLITYHFTKTGSLIITNIKEAK